MCVFIQYEEKHLRAAGVRQMANKEYYGRSCAVIILIIRCSLQEGLQVFDGVPVDMSLHKTNGFNSAQIASFFFLKMEKDT